MTTDQTYLEAVREAHYQVMEEFDDTFVMGEDVRKSLFNITNGLVDEFGEQRVIDTPISEQGFVGTAIGAAMLGKRPIVELQINTLPLVAMDQIVNHAAKIHYMSAGQYSVPLTLTVPMAGASGGNAAQHSDATQSLLMHYGVKTIMPSSPRDAKGLFRSAVMDEDPVIVYFPAVLQGKSGHVPEDPYEIPLGQAEIKRQGDDLSLVAIGEMVQEAEKVANQLEGEISVEIIDPRTLLPLDESTILKSVRKTGRVLITESANNVCSVSSYISSIISDEVFWYLDCPVKCVTRDTVPVSYAPEEENKILPDDRDLIRIIHKMFNEGV